MLSTEIPQQRTLFSGELVDNRTRTQKEADKQRSNPHQDTMFSQRDMAQFGVNPRPMFSLSPKMLLPMMMEDPRTEEEIEADRMKAALDLTTPMFQDMNDTSQYPTEPTETKSTSTNNSQEIIVFDSKPPDEKPLVDPKLAAYLKVVQEAKEVLFWGTTDGVIVTGIAVNLALAVLAANEAGLTQAEIKAAVQIGEQRGLPPSKQLPPIPKIYSAHYWERVEEEAFAFWNEKLQPKSIF